MTNKTKYAVDLQLLYRLWVDDSLTRCEIARQIGVTQSYLGLLQRRHKLPRRAQQRRAFSMDDPTPEEIEQRKAECRERHMQQRRSEKPETSERKANLWRKEGCHG